uniref:Uncharacterized protein n=1 Tax=Ixodes ricinus TaxID=34613 RepID=A0A6B0UNK6_IXORI
MHIFWLYKMHSNHERVQTWLSLVPNRTTSHCVPFQCLECFAKLNISLTDMSHFLPAYIYIYMCTFSFVCTKFRCALKTPFILSGGIYVYLRILGGVQNATFGQSCVTRITQTFFFFNLEL